MCSAFLTSADAPAVRANHADKAIELYQDSNGILTYRLGGLATFLFRCKCYSLAGSRPADRGRLNSPAAISPS